MQQTASSLSTPTTFIGVLASCWGMAGFFLLLLIAINKLSAIALEAFSQNLNAWHWTALLINCVFMAYSEGYKGFQKSYSPRLAARARHLSSHANLLQLILAPLFCMGFFSAPKRRIISSILLTIMIIVFVLTFKLLPQPWRGILDAGVVVGLSWGLLATALFCIQAFFSSSFDIDPEVV